MIIDLTTTANTLLEINSIELCHLIIMRLDWVRVTV